MSWKYGKAPDPELARWGNLAFVVSLLITLFGIKSIPLWWLLSLVTTPVLGLYFLTNFIYGFPKVLGDIFDWIIKKSGLPKLLDAYLSWIDRQIKKLIKSFKK